MNALRVAFVVGSAAAVIALVVHWFGPALATGDRLWLVAFVVWISVFAAAAMIAALCVWEWVSPRVEEVMQRMK